MHARRDGHSLQVKRTEAASIFSADCLIPIGASPFEISPGRSRAMCRLWCPFAAAGGGCIRPRRSSVQQFPQRAGGFRLEIAEHQPRAVWRYPYDAHGQAMAAFAILVPDGETHI